MMSKNNGILDLIGGDAQMLLLICSLHRLIAFKNGKNDTSHSLGAGNF